MKPRNSSISIVIIAIISVLVVSCTSNWPQFRGPESNQIAKVKDLPQEWGDEQNIKWKYPLSGRGWSSPVVWGNRVFITEAILDEGSLPDTVSVEEMREANPKDATYRWMVYCLDLDSGDLIWERMAHEGKPGIPTQPANTYASETPVTDGKRVYVYFGMTGFFCYDYKGNLIWEKDLGTYEMDSGWGSSTSPVLYRNKLYLQLDNQEASFLIAMNKKTGEEIWRIPREENTNYSTPVIWRNRVRTELVTGGLKARSYAPATGRLLWELDLGGGRNITSPVANRDLLFTGNEQRLGSGGFLFAVKAGAEGDITPAEGDSTSSGILWTRPNSGLSMASPLLYNGYIYIIERRLGSIFCYEETTGKPAYQGIRIPDAGPFWSTPWAYDDKIWCLDERGTTHVIKTGEEFEVLARHTIDDKFWSTTAITKKGYVFRGVNNIYCVEKNN